MFEGLQETIFASVGVTVLMTLCGFAFTAAIIFFVFRNVFGGMSKQRQILQTGEAAQAKILRIWDTGTSLNDNPQVGMLLEVQAAGRPPFQVETKAFVSRLRLPAIQPGQTVPVRFDPANPNNIALAL
jgi:hypothetical protein